MFDRRKMARNLTEISEGLITAIPEVVLGDTIVTDDTVPAGLTAALNTAGLVASRINFRNVSAITAKHVLTYHSTLINREIVTKKFTSSFTFTYLIMIEEEALPGDMEENFDFIRQGSFTVDSEQLHYALFKLTRVWVNQ